MLVQAPKQARSEATLRKILDAAEMLLEEKTFDKISIAELMKRACLQVGTFYTRFKTKEDLLPYLYEMYDQGLEKDTTGFLEPDNWRGLALAERVERLVRLCVKTYRARRGLWRAIILYAYTHPGAITSNYRKRRRRMIQKIASLLLECRSEISHPDPSAAVEFGLTFVMATCKDKILLEEASRGITAKISDKRLIAELTRSLLGYLQLRRKSA